MAVAFVAQRGAGVISQGSSTTFAFSPTSTCTAGNFLVLVCGINRSVSGGPYGFSVADNAAPASAWSTDSLADATPTTGYISSLFLDAAIQTSDTITITASAFTAGAYWLEEFTAIRPTLDKSSNANWVSSTAADTGTTAATQTDDELAIALMGWTVTDSVFTDLSSYTAFTTGLQVGTGRQWTARYKILSSVGTQREQATVSSSTGIGVIATYKDYSFVSPVSGARRSATGGSGSSAY